MSRTSNLFAILAVVLFGALPLLARSAKPLVQPVTVIHQRTVAFRIEPENGVAKLSYRDENGDDVYLPRDAGGNFTTCFTPEARRPAFSFDNDTTQAWTIRLLPTPGSSQNGLCHELECARGLAQLKDPAGLCDQPGSNDATCVTSAAALGRCFGPECDVARAACTNTLDPSRNCTLKVADIIAGCFAKSCATTREVAGKTPERRAAKAPPVPVSEYSRATDVLVLPPAGAPQQTAAEKTFPSAGFEPESIPPQGPYVFRLEPAVGSALTLTVNAGTPAQTCVPAARERTTQFAAVVPLDNTGVASWVYLNPRNAACLRCDNQTLLPLAFHNRTSDRSFSVTVELPAEVTSRLGDFERRNCAAGKPCKVTRTIQPNNSTIFGVDVLQAIPEGTLLRFQVGFSDETEKPANPVAFIRVSENVTEPEGSLQTTIAATIGGALDPFIAAPPDKVADLPGFTPCYVAPENYAKETEPALCIGKRAYDGKHARHYTGSVRVDLTKPLGSRADASASVTYRQSDLGIDDGNPLKLSTYTVNVYGLTGMMLRFGRLTWAQPANGIAIAEKGDGYRVSFANFSLTHLVKRESATGKLADPPNKDNRSIIFQAKSLPLNFTTPGIRAFEDGRHHGGPR